MSEKGILSSLFHRLKVVKPYSPNAEVDWENVSFDYNAWTTLFEDPVVAQEFKVYMARECTQLIFIFLASLMVPVLVGPDLMRLRPIPYKVLYLVWVIPSLIIAFFDAKAFWKIDGMGGGGGDGDGEEERGDENKNEDHDVRNSGDGRRRSSALARRYTSHSPGSPFGTSTPGGVDMNTVGEEQNTAETEADGRHTQNNRLKTWSRREAPANQRFITLCCMMMNAFLLASIGTIYLADYNCKEATDVFELIGIRRNPVHGYSPREITAYCSQSVNPLMMYVMLVSVAVVGNPAPTCFFIIAMVCNLIGQILAYTVYPFRGEQRWEDHLGRYVFVAGACVCSLTFHWLNHRIAIKLFIQEIALFRARRQAALREEEADLLLCNILPFSVLDKLSTGQEIFDETDEASVLFSDIKGFTSWSSSRSPNSVVAMLNSLCLSFDLKASRQGVEKIKTIGDAYWAVTGLPDECANHAELLCNFANSMLDSVADQNKVHPEWDGINIRIGIHSGHLCGGILGTQQLSYEVFGETSDIAAKVESQGIPGRVVVTQETVACLGFVDAGTDITGNPVGSVDISGSSAGENGEGGKTSKSSGGGQSAALSLAHSISSFYQPSSSGTASGSATATTRFQSPQHSEGAVAGDHQIKSSSLKLFSLPRTASIVQTFTARQLESPQSGGTVTSPANTAHHHLSGDFGYSPAEGPARRSSVQAMPMILDLNLVGGGQQQGGGGGGGAELSSQHSGKALSSTQGKLSTMMGRSHTSSQQLAKRFKDEAAKRREQFHAMRAQRKKKSKVSARSSNLLGGESSADTMSLSMQMDSLTQNHDGEDEGSGRKSDRSNNADHAEEEIETLEEIEARYSKRKYKYIIGTFADSEVEAQFMRQLGLRQMKLRTVARFGFLGIIACVIFATLVNRGEFSDASIVLLALSGTIELVDLLMCFADQATFFMPRLQAFLQHVAAVLLLLAAGFMPVGSSVLTNDVSALMVAISPMLIWGNIGFVSFITLAGANACVLIPMVMWLTWPVVMFTADVIFNSCTIVMSATAFVVLERMLRIQFLQQHVAEYFRAKQLERNQEQEALLESMVPVHIVGDLMQWMQSGMDPRKTIVQSLPSTAVCFIQLDTASIVTGALEASLNQPLPTPLGSRKPTALILREPPLASSSSGLGPFSVLGSGHSFRSSTATSQQPAVQSPPSLRRVDSVSVGGQRALLMSQASRSATLSINDIGGAEGSITETPPRSPMLDKSSSFKINQATAASPNDHARDDAPTTMMKKKTSSRMWSKVQDKVMNSSPHNRSRNQSRHNSPNGTPSQRSPTTGPMDAEELISFVPAIADELNGSTTTPTGGGKPLSNTPGDSSSTVLENKNLKKISSLLEAHYHVDNILQELGTEYTVKVKTVGDIVMLAGPFEKKKKKIIESRSGKKSKEIADNGSSEEVSTTKSKDDKQVATACHELLLACWNIRQLCALRAGIHVGELVGAVLGNSRLCFDVFGDTVNTTSRVMTSGKTSGGSDVSVSAQLYQLYRRHFPVVAAPAAPVRATLSLQQQQQRTGSTSSASSLPLGGSEWDVLSGGDGAAALRGSTSRPVSMNSSIRSDSSSTVGVGGNNNTNNSASGGMGLLLFSAPHLPGSGAGGARKQQQDGSSTIDPTTKASVLVDVTPAAAQNHSRVVGVPSFTPKTPPSFAVDGGNGVTTTTTTTATTSAIFTEHPLLIEAKGKGTIEVFRLIQILVS